MRSSRNRAILMDLNGAKHGSYNQVFSFANDSDRTFGIFELSTTEKKTGSFSVIIYPPLVVKIILFITFSVIPEWKRTTQLLFPYRHLI